jgi:hypothetical protein
MGPNDEIPERGCRSRVDGLVLTKVRVRGHDWTGVFLARSEHFTSINAEPATDFSKRFQIGEVAALYPRERGGARSDLSRDRTDASIAAFLD